LLSLHWEGQPQGPKFDCSGSDVSIQVLLIPSCCVLLDSFSMESRKWVIVRSFAAHDRLSMTTALDWTNDPVLFRARSATAVYYSFLSNRALHLVVMLCSSLSSRLTHIPRIVRTKCARSRPRSQNAHLHPPDAHARLRRPTQIVLEISPG